MGGHCTRKTGGNVCIRPLPVFRKEPDRMDVRDGNLGKARDGLTVPHDRTGLCLLFYRLFHF